MKLVSGIEASRSFRLGTGVFKLMYRLNVRFVMTRPLQIQIKYTMKTSATTQSRRIIPSLFRIASLIEDFDSAPLAKPAPPKPTPFADLMLHPEKLEMALKRAKRENDAFDAGRKFSCGTNNGATQETQT
jgi:hypothetical protein